MSVPNFLSGKVFGAWSLLILKAQPFYVAEFGTDSFLVRAGRKMFHVVFAGRRMVMGIYFGNVLFSLSACA